MRAASAEETPHGPATNPYVKRRAWSGKQNGELFELRKLLLMSWLRWIQISATNKTLPRQNRDCSSPSPSNRLSTSGTFPACVLAPEKNQARRDGQIGEYEMSPRIALV